jgi:hypothetical protein
VITQASVLDADAILHVNRVNKRYSNDVPYTAEDYRAALNTKNEFFLIARRGVGNFTHSQRSSGKKEKKEEKKEKKEEKKEKKEKNKSEPVTSHRRMH